MNIALNWARQNLVTVVEIVEVLYQAVQLVVNAIARIVAFTPSVSDDTFVAKIHNGLKAGEPILKKVKSFLLGTAG